MNDLINFAKLWLIEGDISPHDLGFMLNDVLLSALRQRSPVVTEYHTRHSSCLQIAASRAKLAREVDPAETEPITIQISLSFG